MRYNASQIARKIDRLAEYRRKMASLYNRASDMVLAIREAGGGESKRFRAELVKMPKKTVVIRAHKQVRLYAKTH